MPIDIIFSRVIIRITSDFPDTPSLIYSDVIDQKGIGHGEVDEIDILPVV